MPHRREHAFDRVRGSQVVPMIGGKVEDISSVCRSLIRHSTALSYLGAYFSAKIVIAASAAPRLGDTRSRADPYARWVASTSGACRARSMSCAASIADDVSSGTPRQGPSRPERAIANGCLRRDDQAARLQIDEQLLPALPAFPHAGLKADQLLLPSGVAPISTSMHSACGSMRACK